MFDSEKINELATLYFIPWAISIVTAILVFVIGRIIIKILNNILGKVLSRTKLDIILIEFIQVIVRVLLMIFVIVAALDQLGVNTTSLIAVLGAAGLAIGLALQGSLQNFAAGFLLLILRPFKAGDYIEAAGIGGMVEKISIFSTVLRTPDNKEVTVPNGSIYSGNIVNYSARSTRRVDLVFGISYGDDIKTAKEVMLAAVKSDPRVLEDPAPNVAVSALADSSVNFIVRPWVNTDDYWPVYWDMTEKIKIALEENGMTIPFPQIDLHLDKVLEGSKVDVQDNSGDSSGDSSGNSSEDKSQEPAQNKPE